MGSIEYERIGCLGLSRRRRGRRGLRLRRHRHHHHHGHAHRNHYAPAHYRQET
jgi:hypothetical protein